MTNLDTAFRSLFETNMGIAANETVLVFSDRIRQDEAPSEADRDRRQRLNETASQAAGFASSSYCSGQFVDFPATTASGALGGHLRTDDHVRPAAKRHSGRPAG